jgi:TnpA family transposase
MAAPAINAAKRRNKPRRKGTCNYLRDKDARLRIVHALNFDNSE